MRIFADTFQVAEAPAQLVTQLIADLDDFVHLRRHVFGCVFSQRVLTDRGGFARAVIGAPAQITAKPHERQFVEWAYANLFRQQLGGELPDFVIFFDISLWQRDNPEEREQLVYHELCHVQQRKDEYGAPRFEKDGRPMLRIAAHDVEVFHAELKRYGDVVPVFDETAISLATGARRRRPGRRVA